MYMAMLHLLYLTFRWGRWVIVGGHHAWVQAKSLKTTALEVYYVRIFLG